MIFQSIDLNNLFTYFGKQTFDLRGSGPGKNVVLITGRNGFGKTSLLNGVKLLFSGVTESMRQSVQRQRTPNTKQYIVGTGDDWWGIMNRRARSAGEQHCGVRIVWEEDGNEVVAERTWEIGENDFEEELTITAVFLDQALKGDEAQRFLEQRLPRDYVPFFFFDGEQIQELAEANRAAQQQHIERLLNIAHVEALRTGIVNVISDWREASMDQAEQTRLAQLKAELAALENQQATFLQSRQGLEEDIAEIKASIKDLNRKLGSYRSFVRQQDVQKLNDEKKRLQGDDAELCRKVVETLPRDIPLLANPVLVERAADEVMRLLSDTQASQREVVRQLLHFLPSDLLDRPPHSNPPLSNDQREHYRNRLVKLLEAYAPAKSSAEKKLISLDAQRAESLSRLLGAYHGGHALRAERVADLRRLQALRGRLREIEEELANASAMSVSERQAYEQYTAELEQKQQHLIDREAEYRSQGSDLGAAATNIAKKQEEIARQEDRVNLSQHVRRKVDMARKLQSFFVAYKERLRAGRRAEVEEALNRHFQVLMTSNRLIRHIRVDEDFGLHYLDEAENPVGMGNLSAGMKQLAATALLWALKECSGRPLPIIVDTPLARIDRGNQENLLRNYYPNASQQVIVLPTDSELDEGKYRILEPYIYAEYQLLNPDGDQVEIWRRPMYPTSEEGFHG